MFILEALVLTFMTTPLVIYFYPPHLRRRIAASGANFDHVPDEEGAVHNARGPLRDGEFKMRFTVVLDKLENVPGMMALTQLIQAASPPNASRERKGPSGHEPRTSSQSISHTPGVSLEALRLIELSDRVSDVMKSSMSDTLLLTDPLLAIFRMFGQLIEMHVSPALSVVKFHDMAYSVAEHARAHESDLIVLPWLPPVHDAFDGPPPGTPSPSTPMQKPNPFDMLFRTSNFLSGGALSGVDVSNSASVVHSQFVRGVFSQATTDVALFVDQSPLALSSIVGGGETQQQLIFLPFFGGPDDRLALEFMVQICSNPRVRGMVVRVTKTEGDVTILPSNAGKNMEEINALTVGSVRL